MRCSRIQGATFGLELAFASARERGSLASAAGAIPLILGYRRSPVGRRRLRRRIPGRPRDTDHPQFVRFTTGAGLSTDWANAITGDLNGRIYVGTVHGVDRIDPNTGRITHLTAADGLASNAVISAFRDRSGELWFGTRNGLSKLTISRNPAAAPPAVRLTEVSIDDRPIPLSDFGESRA
jgi:hypothetical protein